MNQGKKIQRLTLKSFPPQRDEVLRQTGCFLHLKLIQCCGHKVTSQACKTHTDPKHACRFVLMAVGGTVVFRETWTSISTAGTGTMTGETTEGWHQTCREDFAHTRFNKVYPESSWCRASLWCFSPYRLVQSWSSGKCFKENLTLKLRFSLPNKKWQQFVEN